MSKKKKKTRKDKSLTNDFNGVIKQKSGKISLPINFTLLACLIIALSGFLAYFNTLDGSFIMDDVPNIAENYKIQSLGNFLNISTWYDINFRPMANLTFAANYYFHGLSVFGYHLTNILIHIITGLIIFFFIRFIFTIREFKNNPLSDHAHLISLFTALLFVLHPIQTQAVSYIIQRMASLSALFYILSIFLYAKGRVCHTEQGLPGQAKVYYIAALFAGLLAVLSKQNAATFPLAMLLFELFFIKNNRNEPYKNFIIISFAAMLLAFLTVALSGRLPADTTDISRSEYLISQFRVIVKYIQLSILPINQKFDYHFPASKTLWGFKEIGSLFIILCILTLAFRLRKKQKLISFGIFWFFLALSVESSLIPIRDLIFEHRLYLSMMGFSLCFVTFFYTILSEKHLQKIIVILSIISIIYGAASYNRNKVWKTKFALWNDNVDKDSDTPRPLYKVGMEYTKSGDYEKALEYLKKALDKSPRSAKILTGVGIAYREKGDYETAISYFNKALAIRPNDTSILDKLGTAYHKKGELEKALEYYNLALKQKPDYLRTLENVGDLYKDSKNYEQAIIYYNRVLDINKNHLNVLSKMGALYTSMGDEEKAMTYYNHVMEINPEHVNVIYNLATNLFQQGNIDGAIKQYEKVLEVNPKHIQALNNIGFAWFKKGDYDRAIEYYNRALIIKPDYFRVMSNMGSAWAKKGDLDKAIEFYKKALEIEPGYPEALKNLQIVQQIKDMKK